MGEVPRTVGLNPRSLGSATSFIDGGLVVYFIAHLSFSHYEPCRMRSILLYFDALLGGIIISDCLDCIKICMYNDYSN
jgi:hypothetical protein